VARFGRGGNLRTAGVVVLLATLCASLPWSAAGQTPAASERILRFGLSGSLLDGVVSPNDALAAIRIWAKEVLTPIVFSADAEAALFQDTASLMNAVNSSTLDLVALSTTEYLSVEGSLQADPSLVYVLPEGVNVQYVVVARTGVTSVLGIAGRAVAIPNASNHLDLLGTWLDVVALESGLGARDRAFQLRPMQKASQALLAVFFKQADAAVVVKSAFDTAVELNPQLGKELTIVARSPLILPGLVCIRRSLDPEVRRRWVETATQLNQNPHARQTFLILRAVRMDPWLPRYLDTARALLQRRAALMKRAAQ
jgi:phosphonate transport system substrate-binding protein